MDSGNVKVDSPAPDKCKHGNMGKQKSAPVNRKKQPIGKNGKSKQARISKPVRDAGKRATKPAIKRPALEATKHETAGSSYTNFVASSSAAVAPVESATNTPLETIPDPGLPQRSIQLIQNVTGYMYSENRLSLKQSFEQAGILLKTDYNESTQVFRYLANNREICSATGEKQEAYGTARDKLAQIIMYYCYTVKRVKEYHTRSGNNSGIYKKIPGTEKEDKNKLGADHVGFKMLQKLGWSGGALGSNEDGILEPIMVKKKTDKAGIGSVEEKVEKIPIEAFILAIKRYAGGNALYDLVFSTQFSKHQVAKLRDCALSLKLLAQRIGKKKQLVVSKNLTINEIKVGVEKGHTALCAKYIVIPPACGAT